ncbi:MAG: Fic family protein [Gammaproteobacteria bacterium]
MKIPQSPPQIETVLSDPGTDVTEMLKQGPLYKGQYLHWDQLRHRSPPAKLTPEAWWAGIKIARRAFYIQLPLQDKDGQPVKFGIPAPVLRALYEIDSQAPGSVAMPGALVSSDDRDRYLVSSLIEEAITSSQLEGAATTREVAKAMLRSGRSPQDRNERMILNNFHVMQRIRELQDEPLTPELILFMHRIVTEGTLDDPGAEGRLRRANEKISVMDATHTIVLHEPPQAKILPARLQRLCAFANQNDSAEPFVHPVIRAILLHYMLAYDHPFVDGNGRTARALFYWSMARAGYWLMEYISISRLIKEAPVKYGYAYLYSETDNNDVTYFIIHQLDIIQRAIVALHEYLERKGAERRSAEKLLRYAPVLANALNHRQVAILSHALRHPGHDYTVESHRRSHQITPQTARTDLLQLVELNLFEQYKRGRAFVFAAQEDLRQRIEAAAKKKVKIGKK